MSKRKWVGLDKLFREGGTWLAVRPWLGRRGGADGRNGLGCVTIVGTSGDGDDVTTPNTCSTPQPSHPTGLHLIFYTKSYLFKVLSVLRTSIGGMVRCGGASTPQSARQSLSSYLRAIPLVTPLRVLTQGGPTRVSRRLGSYVPLCQCPL
ncbi:hypothetical protein E2C01_040104 [Portunus trituberculatus]|uniref:Uncharacterized protein n=1 Tax=Portunus trituberculatus TaxID=210409 RepID=A0A5B7FMQ0_PORTR|nr:hypothetical protein [Portunus trituberculatus]